MIGEPCYTYVEEVTEQSRQNNSNKNVHFIGVSTSELTADALGSDWHPNTKGQQKIADKVLPVIQSVMNW
jgi:lysophospholipase L1-like esterase